jgi:hypothetical protein
MSDIIPAAPGWRVCCWVREHGHAMALPIVAWQPRDNGRGGVALEPLVLNWEGNEVAEPSKYDWFVGIMPPGSDLYDYSDAAEEVAKAEEEAEDRAAA